MIIIRSISLIGILASACLGLTLPFHSQESAFPLHVYYYPFSEARKTHFDLHYSKPYGMPDLNKFGLNFSSALKRMGLESGIEACHVSDVYSNYTLSAALSSPFENRILLKFATISEIAFFGGDRNAYYENGCEVALRARLRKSLTFFAGFFGHIEDREIFSVWWIDGKA